jgi:hypothetical protein
MGTDAAALRSARVLSQEEVDRRERERDAERGPYVAHQGAHHYREEARQ